MLIKMMRRSGAADETRAIAMALSRAYSNAAALPESLSIDRSIKIAELMRLMSAVRGAGREDWGAVRSLVERATDQALAEAVRDAAWKAAAGEREFFRALADIARGRTDSEKREDLGGHVIQLSAAPRARTSSGQQHAPRPTTTGLVGTWRGRTSHQSTAGVLRKTRGSSRSSQTSQKQQQQKQPGGDSSRSSHGSSNSRQGSRTGRRQCSRSGQPTPQPTARSSRRRDGERQQAANQSHSRTRRGRRSWQ